MEQFFAVMFKEVGQKRSFLFLLSLTDPDIVRLSKFTDYEINILKNLELEKSHRQGISKEHVAMSLLESQLE